MTARMTRDDLSPRALALLQSAADPAGIVLGRTPETFSQRVIATGLLASGYDLVTIDADRDAGVERVRITPAGRALLDRPTRAELATRRRRIVAALAGAVLLAVSVIVAALLRG